MDCQNHPPRRSEIAYGVLIVGLGVATLLPGCRAARSGVGRLPGMSWVGPRDEAVAFEDWDDSTITRPADKATPQVATQGSPSTSSSSQPPPARRSYPLDLDVDEPDAADVAESEAYPDTGYPTPYPLSSPTESAADHPSSQLSDSGSSTRSPPERGFYSDHYEEPEVEPAAEEVTEDVRQQYSRFSQGVRQSAEDNLLSGTADQESAINAGRDAARDGPSDLGRYADEVTDRADELLGESSRFGSDDRPSASRFGDVAQEAVGEPLRDSARDVQGSVNDYAGAAEDALLGGGSSEPDSEAYGGVRDAYEQFADQSPAAHDEAIEPFGGLSPETDQPVASEPTQRRRRPWRPGSTGSFERTDSDQSRRPYGVAPVSYPAAAAADASPTARFTSDRRLTPSYR